jgi:hypothetical protein
MDFPLKPSNQSSMQSIEDWLLGLRGKSLFDGRHYLMEKTNPKGLQQSWG